jgi:hypothetical protein
MKVKIILCIITILGCIAVAYAELRKDDGFWYDDSLKQAQDEILKMQSEELEALINFLASCDSLSNTESSKCLCEKDKSLFVIKYQRDRVIDIFVSSLLTNYDMKLFSKETTPSESVQIIDRRLLVKRALDSAARARFQTLNYAKIRKPNAP